MSYDNFSIEEIEQVIENLNHCYPKSPKKPIMNFSKDMNEQEKNALQYLEDVRLYNESLSIYNKNKEDFNNRIKLAQNTWVERLFSFYPKLSEETKNYIHKEAYDSGHSAGYSEVRLYFEKYVDMVQTAISLEIKNGNIK